MSEPILAPNMSAAAREHVQRYLDTSGAVGHMWRGPGMETPVPTLILTTTGRKTGQRYRNALIYGKTNGSYVIVGSNRGAPGHPGWYRNLVAHPEAEVQVLSEKISARARTAAGAEHMALWKQMAKLFPPYVEYLQASGREIPVVVLDAVSAQ